MGSFDFVLMTVEEVAPVEEDSKIYIFLKKICKMVDKICEYTDIDETESECINGTLIISLNGCSFQEQRKCQLLSLLLDEADKFKINNKGDNRISMIFEFNLGIKK